MTDIPPQVLDPDRLAAVHATGLLDTPPEPEFDELATLAATVLQAPFAFITLVDDFRSFWKAAIGLPAGAARQITVSESFCQYVIAQPGQLLVDNARTDPRTCDNPSIAAMGVAAWAGTTLLSPEGHAIGSFCVVDLEPRTWTERDGEVLRALAAAATAQIALHEAAQREQRLGAVIEDERRLLQETVDRAAVGVVLCVGHELRIRVINDLARSVLPDRGPLIGRAVVEAFPEMREIAESMILPILESGQTVTVSELPVSFGGPASLDGQRFYEVTWSPVRDAGEITGVLATYRETTDEVRRHRLLTDELEAERNITDALQWTLLPAVLPEVDGLEVAARYRPADDRMKVGGDFYDLFAASDGSYVAIVGDVCGKGPAAAATTASARWTLRAEAQHGSSPAMLLAHLNRVLLAGDRSAMSAEFLTLVVARLRPRPGGGFAVTLACAGHPPALLHDPVRGDAVVGGTGDLIGLRTRVAHEEVEVALPAGGRLVLYSDGLLDAQAPQRGLLPEDLLETVAKHDQVGELASALLSRATGEQPARDDIALLALAAR